MSLKLTIRRRSAQLTSRTDIEITEPVAVDIMAYAKEPDRFALVERTALEALLATAPDAPHKPVGFGR